MSHVEVEAYKQSFVALLSSLIKLRHTGSNHLCTLEYFSLHFVASSAHVVSDSAIHWAYFDIIAPAADDTSLNSWTTECKWLTVFIVSNGIGDVTLRLYPTCNSNS